MAFILVRVLSGDIATVVVNLTHCLGLKRQISTGTFNPVTARSLPIVRLCHMSSRRELHNRRTRRLYPSNIQRPHTLPDITTGCTPCHHVPLLNRFRVRYRIPTSPSAIRLLPLPPLPRALASHRNSWRLRLALTLSHPPRIPTRRRSCPPTLPMELSRLASVQ